MVTDNIQLIKSIKSIYKYNSKKRVKVILVAVNMP